MTKAQQAAPVCEECDIPMHPFSFGSTEGWGCDGCGWSIDNEWPAASASAVSSIPAGPQHYRAGNQRYVLEGAVLKNVRTGDSVPFEKAENPVPYREATNAEFHEALSRVLKPAALSAMLASKMHIPDQCTFVAREAFLENLSPDAKAEDIALLRQTMWHLSMYDGTTGLR